MCEYSTFVLELVKNNGILQNEKMPGRVLCYLIILMFSIIKN